MKAASPTALPASTRRTPHAVSASTSSRAASSRTSRRSSAGSSRPRGTTTRTSTGAGAPRTSAPRTWRSGTAMRTACRCCSAPRASRFPCATASSPSGRGSACSSSSSTASATGAGSSRSSVISASQLSFAAIPGTIERLLTGSSRGTTLPLDGVPGTDRVLFVYLDAFAWRFFERHARHPLLDRARRDGLVLELVSQFPSTTAAHTTTLHSGLPVGVHGVYEWHILEPSLDRLITPLMFSFAGDDERDTLLRAGLTADAVFPADTLHVRLTAAGVRSVAVMPVSIVRTVTNRALLHGADCIPARSAADAFARARSALAASDRVYASVYLPTFDAIMHRVGPDAPAARAELASLLDAIAAGLRRVPAGTLILIGTDHGMAPISPARTSYVNVAWPELAGHLRHGADGKPLAPAGSCRDLFLHVLPGHVDAVVDGLAERLGDVADVLPTRTLLDE